MAAQLALAINEVRLVEGLIDAQEKINNDLRLGRIVQAQIIPPKISPWNGVCKWWTPPGRCKLVGRAQTTERCCRDSAHLPQLEGAVNVRPLVTSPQGFR